MLKWTFQNMTKSLRQEIDSRKTQQSVINRQTFVGVQRCKQNDNHEEK
jgi:hypothetical protein